MLVTVGPLISGLSLLVAGCVLAHDGHPILAWGALAVAIWTIYNSFHDLPPSAGGTLPIEA